MNTAGKRFAIIMPMLFAGGLTVALSPISAFSEETAKAVFQKTCASCHGMEGKGDGLMSAAFPVKPRDFSDCNLMKGVTRTSLFDMIKKGGAAIGKSPLMPPFEGALSEKQINDQVTFIESFCKK